MGFEFDIEKSIQASACFLGLAPGQRLPYLVLVKLLYLADREELREVGYPLAGDTAHALPHGPILGQICDLIRLENMGEYGELWNQRFETNGAPYHQAQERSWDIRVVRI